MALDSDRRRIAHLLRRATFGVSAAELEEAVQAGYQATLERLLNPETQADDVDGLVPRDAFDLSQRPDCVRYWLLRMVHTKRQLLEKMTFFWHGHLTSSLAKTGNAPWLMVQQIDTYRSLALGSFRDLVLASAKDPAMILWLDNNQNRKGKPNENYARELMELFTLGIGNYTEQDVREAARAFTGWFQRDGQFVFVPGQHDGGTKTVLGHTGPWDGTDVIDIVVRHPACAPFIARKLWTFFAYPDPEPEVINDLAGVFVRSRYDIRATMRALFTHPAFFTERAYHALIKSPVEFAVGFLRTLEARTDGVLLNGALPLMGQVPLAPPNVAGWPGGPAWISTSTLIARDNVATQALRTGPDQPTFIDVLALLRRHRLPTPEAILDFFVDLMVDGDLPEAKRRVLAEYLVARDDGTPGPFTLDERTVNNKVRGLIALLAATPEYQLA